MKRVYVLLVFVFGLVAGLAYLSFASIGSVDPSTMWSILQSWFRRGYQTVSTQAQNTVGSADPFQQALALIAGFEGFSAKAYPDADGFSIGYGHFITPDDPYDANSVISESDAWALLEQDAAGAQACIANAVGVPITTGQQAALVSLCYNIGCGAFQNSTLLKKLNAGDYAGATAQFAVWNKSGGQVISALVTRRTSEAEVFNS
jgi:lysozyme